jgi:uncharacterized protein (UPF0276 family)
MTELESHMILIRIILTLAVNCVILLCLVVINSLNCDWNKIIFNFVMTYCNIYLEIRNIYSSLNHDMFVHKYLDSFIKSFI